MTGNNEEYERNKDCQTAKRDTNSPLTFLSRTPLCSEGEKKLINEIRRIRDVPIVIKPTILNIVLLLILSFKKGILNTDFFRAIGTL
jgi:hypothetical protein